MDIDAEDGRIYLPKRLREKFGDQFELVDRGVPRHGYDVTNTDDLVVGEVTSGTMSPTLDRPIGLAYVSTDYTDPGTTLRVVVRGQSKQARVESLPFYER